MELQWYQPSLEQLIISGADASDFLHRLTTQDFKNFRITQKKYAALLNPNSTILNLFLAEKASENSYFLWTLDAHLLQKNLEHFHFAEDLVFDLTGKKTQIHEAMENDQRVDAGFFKWGVDVTDKNLLLEIPYQNFLATQKGCYPGQEVIERVFTYGKVAKKLVLIDLAKHSLDEIQQKGKLTSQGVKKAFAFIQKPFYETF